MKHSDPHKRSLMAWLVSCAEQGQPMPTDAAIMDRFGFATPELARTLLADLADAGEIRLRGVGTARTIEIGARQRAAMTRAIAEPAVRKAVPPTRMDMIRAAAAAIAARTAPRSQQAPVPAVVPTPRAQPVPPAPPIPARTIAPIAPIAAVALPAPPPSKESFMPTPPGQPVLLRPAVPGEKRQVTFTATGAVLDRLIAAAVAADSGLGPATLAIVTRAVADPPTNRAAAAPMPEGKPRLSAAVLRAWRASGQDFSAFLTTAIERGVASMAGE